MVSRTAGESERCISSFIRLRGTALRNHAPPASPSFTAAGFSGPVRLYRASRSRPVLALSASTLPASTLPALALPAPALPVPTLPMLCHLRAERPLPIGALQHANGDSPSRCCQDARRHLWRGCLIHVVLAT